MDAPAVNGPVLRSSRDAVDPRLRSCLEHALTAELATPVAAAMREVAGRVGGAPRPGEVRLDGPKFCSYSPGQYFRAHRDRSLDPLDPAAVRNRRLTMVCLLNDADPSDGLPIFDGGALVLHMPHRSGQIRPVNIPPRTGSIVAFPADLLHEVRPVRSGIRYSAISWLFTVSETEESSQ